MCEIMTPDEFATQMEQASDVYFVNGDEEIAHIMHDRIMCDLLRSLGYGEGIDIFESCPKWYA